MLNVLQYVNKHIGKTSKTTTTKQDFLFDLENFHAGLVQF